MFNSVVLETAIGLAMIYLLLSTVCSGLYEFIAGVTAKRAKDLQTAIRNLLADPASIGVARAFYEHPIIRGLGTATLRGYERKSNPRPSYVPARLFALTLLDLAAPARDAPGPRGLESLRSAVKNSATIQDSLRSVLLVHIDAAGQDVEKVLQGLERWFNDAMDRLSGLYKRQAQIVILILGLLVSWLFNVDTILVANGLWRDPTLRAAVVAAAEKQAAQSPPATDHGHAVPLISVTAVMDSLTVLNLPIGWPERPAAKITAAGDVPRRDPREWPTDGRARRMRVLGWLLTAFAVSLGAPFWFDILNKVVNLRGTGAKPKTADART